jgi:hypothetical protein
VAKWASFHTDTTLVTPAVRSTGGKTAGATTNSPGYRFHTDPCPPRQAGNTRVCRRDSSRRFSGKAPDPREGLRRFLLPG